MVELEKQEDNGIIYWRYKSKKQSNGVMTADDRRVMEGKFDITLMLGSIKFDDELHFCIFSDPINKIIPTLRNGSKWNRIEINIKHINVEEITNCIEALKQMRLILNPNYKSLQVQQKLDFAERYK
jgi:hypothetical protein